MSGSVVRPESRKRLIEGPLGAELPVGADATGGGFALVEHPLAPRTLGAPVHTHRNEDEYSFILAGTVGVELGGETLAATAGDLVVKPRGVPHAFWNASDRPARLLELIVPGGFERYFAELGVLMAAPGPPDLAAVAALAARYELEFDVASIGRLAAAHGLDGSGGR